MILQIPVRNDLPAYEFRISLDGSVYIMSFRYNNRMDRWIMDLMTGEGEPIMMGIVILVNTSLLGKSRAEGLPPSLLFAINLVNENENPSRKDLGENVLLLYQESQ